MSEGSVREGSLGEELERLRMEVVQRDHWIALLRIINASLLVALYEHVHLYAPGDLLEAHRRVMSLLGLGSMVGGEGVGGDVKGDESKGGDVKEEEVKV